jgi:DNA primase
MIDKPDIIDTLRAEGIGFRQRGRLYWALCPFHSEKTASMKIDPDRQTFHCFGCGAHGDAIAFIQRRHCLDFRSALSYLGVTGGRLDGEARKRIEREQQKRAAVLAFREWCADYFNELADNYRLLQQTKERCRIWADVERISWLYHQESEWQYRMNILDGHNDEQKFDLYRERMQYAA